MKQHTVSSWNFTFMTAQVAVWTLHALTAWALNTVHIVKILVKLNCHILVINKRILRTISMLIDLCLDLSTLNLIANSV